MSERRDETGAARDAGTDRPVDGGAASPSIERGTYEIIRDRLIAQSRELDQKTQTINAKRLELFGGMELAVIGNERLRTENNCVPRDIVRVGDRLLFGYNVFFGLQRDTSVADVFSAHRFNEDGSSTSSFEPAPANFLEDEKFRQDFAELYRYYKDAKLLQLRALGSKLLAVFQTGRQVSDFKVLRWAVDADDHVTYVDNRGERDHVFARAHDFDWTPTSREDHVAGKHPHVDVLGKVFIETIGGDLTLKVENNTEDGLGIYREPVDDADQSLDDAEIHYADLGTLVLLRVLPYNETGWRYLVFNTRTRQVERIDAIGHACQRLPEDHGIVFPGGYYLVTGEKKIFDDEIEDLEFVKRIRSPHGEDVLYVFHHRENGHTLLLPYNLIRKQVATAIACHGYALFPSGKMVVFRALGDEPTRVHPMQIWQTPFQSDEVAAAQMSASATTFLEKIGNPELVRGISDAYSLVRAIAEQKPTVAIYDALIASAAQMLDAYHWLGHEDTQDLAATVAEIRDTAQLALAEFEKTESMRAQAAESIEEAAEAVLELKRGITPRSWSGADEYIAMLSALRKKRGQLVSLRDVRYIDLERLGSLEAEVVSAYDELSQSTVEYLRRDEALAPYHRRLESLEGEIEGIDRVAASKPIAEALDEIDEQLRLVGDVISGLAIDDATVRTELLESTSEVLARLNRTRAVLDGRRQGLRSREAKAEFGAEFKLLAQSVTGAINLATTPDECDTGLARLMVSVEELEARYSDFDEFLEPLTTKREEIYEAFSSKKQRLLDERQRRAQHLFETAERILETVRRRSGSMSDLDELNSYFASDAMVTKLRDLAGDLRELTDAVRADEVEAALKSAQQEATRALRDRRDIFEEGTEVIRFGPHRFSVNAQPLDLTLIPRDGTMGVSLTGTDFFETIADEAFAETKPYWPQRLVSETDEVYRGEYLAGSLLLDAMDEVDGADLSTLHADSAAGTLEERVRQAASERYDEGYDRGVHDQDAAKILGALLQLETTAGRLRFPASSRSLAALTWAFGIEDETRETLHRRARNLRRLREAFGRQAAHDELIDELEHGLTQFVESLGTDFPGDRRLAATYLLEEIGRPDVRFVLSGAAADLVEQFQRDLRDRDEAHDFDEDQHHLDGELTSRLQLARAWLDGFAARRTESDRPLPGVIAEATVQLLIDGRLEREPSHAATEVTLEGLLGQHARIDEGRLHLRLDDFLERLTRFRRERVPGYRDYQQRRHDLLDSERHRLRISELEPRVMSAFVRNQLIDKVYLPIIGDNLAKQLGTVGADKRTDQMGLLLLISPPGYGKTTLMEYVANRLGLVFVKVNGPALGHDVTSFDPADAPNATARQEVDKINLALEMANNVLLYLDDIQHTSSELLQKFISLCDAQRRAEGVWKGRTQTYDLRGKRFAVCMAGNPYTESGEKFQIPDMLANRADTYNLGDVLSGKESLFELSYIENSLTSNSVLAPLSGREPEDVVKLVRMARGEIVQADELSHPYSAVELEEILQVLRHLLRIQQVLLAVNRAYIDSASMDDASRTEPRFQLQGSYRNMNRLAEKVVPVMNSAELEALLDDHYRGEAQTLTSGAEANLLKLRELRDVLSESEAARWAQVKASFQRQQAMGGGEDDPVTRVTGTLGLLADRLSHIGTTIETASARPARLAPSTGDTGTADVSDELAERLDRLHAALVGITEKVTSPGAAAPSESTKSEPSPLPPKVVLDRLAGLALGLDNIGAAIDKATQTLPSVASTLPSVPAASRSLERRRLMDALPLPAGARRAGAARRRPGAARRPDLDDRRGSDGRLARPEPLDRPDEGQTRRTRPGCARPHAEGIVSTS